MPKGSTNCPEALEEEGFLFVCLFVLRKESKGRETCIDKGVTYNLQVS